MSNVRKTEFFVRRTMLIDPTKYARRISKVDEQKLDFSTDIHINFNSVFASADAVLTIQLEKPTRKLRKPSKCLAGKLYCSTARANTRSKQASHSCRAASSMGKDRWRARII